MLSKTSVGTMMSLFIVLTLALSTQPIRAESRTWTVDDDGPADFSKIQDAIDAASDGDTIHVETGTYYENVVVNKQVSLLGKNKVTTVIDGSNFGIVVAITTNSVVMSNFTVQASGSNYVSWDSGICLNSANCCRIANNIVRNNGYYGINLMNHSFDNTLLENKVIYNSRIGINVADYSSNNNLSANTVANTYEGYGISIHYSHDLYDPYGNNLSNNRIANNKYGGILINPWSQYNKIIGNTIENNTGKGIGVASNYNRLFHNNFINNAAQVSIDNPCNNIWNDSYPSGGNFWNDYTGADIKKGSGQDQHGSDGIGDTPYVIDASNQDHYPLMYRFGSPSPQYYTLTITSSHGGTTNPVPGAYSYSQGQTVPVTAIPHTGYNFDHWELDSTNYYQKSINVTMNQGHSLHAVFVYSGVPEFPMGSALYIAAIPLLFYIWWKRRQKALH